MRTSSIAGRELPEPPKKLGGLAPTKWGGCFSHEFYVPIHRGRKNENIMNDQYGYSCSRGRDFSMSPLCVKPFLYCHNTICGRDNLWNHVLLPQKLGYRLLSRRLELISSIKGFLSPWLPMISERPSLSQRNFVKGF